MVFRRLRIFCKAIFACWLRTWFEKSPLGILGHRSGIAPATIEDGKLPVPYVTDVDASRAISAIPGPVAGVVAKLVLKTGDALAFGAPVYLDGASGAYHVTATQPMSGGDWLLPRWNDQLATADN